MSIAMRILITVILLLLLDLYAFQAVKTATKSAPLWKWIYWGTTIAGYLLFLLVLFTFDRYTATTPRSINVVMGFMIMFYVPKLILSIFLLGEDFFRTIFGGVRSIAGSPEISFMPDRRRFVSTLALGVAAVPFLGIIHGIWKGRYRYRVLRHTIFFDNLPEAFDGFTITQLSDIHSGSFDNREKIQYGIQLANDQQSDVIVFTGDLVNNVASEMNPWVSEFAELNAPMGKFSVLGNHDYGDYVPWPSLEAKARNLESLEKIHNDIGFKLLRNQHHTLTRDGQQLHLLGVENWGFPPFPQYGDLNKTLGELPGEDFKVLLSHDPSHFDGEVKSHKNHIALTLSGHTHGMQFGIEIPGWIKWSPVKYRYAKWAGLYEELGRYLYVNRGFGFLAFPGRVGIWPEITVLELRRR
jgi:predicted MPP superfamily phosphohydrolase